MLNSLGKVHQIFMLPKLPLREYCKPVIKSTDTQACICLSSLFDRVYFARMKHDYPLSRDIHILREVNLYSTLSRKA